MSSNLTEKEANLLKTLTKTGDLVHSIRESGYTENDIIPVLSRPRMRAAVDAQTRVLLDAYKMAAVSFLGQLVQDPKASIRERRAAAVDILKFGGIVPPKAPDAEKRAADPESYKTEELQQFIDRGRAELAKRAKPVIDGESRQLGPPEERPEIDLSALL